MKINIDKIGSSFKELIERHISKYGNIPSCFGNMGQTPIEKEQDIISDCIAPINLTIKSDIAVFLDKVIAEETSNLNPSQYCITQTGVDYIDGIKDNIIKKYVDKLVKCTTCTLFDRCNAVTTHTLKRIELEVLYNKT